MAEMYVERSVRINKPNQEVFDYLKHTRNQEEFSVWNMKDPGKKTESSGADGTIGFIYSWDSKDKNVGAGSQEIKNITEGSEIEYEIRFERPMKNVGQSKFVLSELSGQETQVTWIFSCPSKFPMSLFKGIFQNMLGKDMTKSLGNLKGRLER
jgi:uncharacterized protein YndB with AHSA1/START domain